MHDKDSVIPKILDGLKNGSPEYQACQAAGVSWQVFWEWKRDVPGLDERVEAAKCSRVGLLEDALYKAALKGSVTACMVLLRKESKKWRELIDGQIIPDGSQMAATLGAVAGASAILGMLNPEKREKIRAAMRREGMIIDVNPALPEIPNGTNGNSSNGNGTH